MTQSEERLPRVLCVDDDVRILRGLRRLLRNRAELSLCEDGHSALRQLAEEDFDLLLTDMRMPRLDGAEVCVRALKLKPEVPRVVLTGYSDLEQTRLAVEGAEVFRVLVKPCSREELLDTFEEARGAARCA